MLVDDILWMLVNVLGAKFLDMRAEDRGIVAQRKAAIMDVENACMECGLATL